jgi:hypothetical protein
VDATPLWGGPDYLRYLIAGRPQVADAAIAACERLLDLNPRDEVAAAARDLLIAVPRGGS